MEFLVRYGELALKSEGVRKKFETLLARNVSKHFRNAGMHAQVILERGRILASCESPEPLKDVIGVTSYSPIVECEPDQKEITEKVLALAKEKLDPGKTFRLSFRREWKEFPKTSREMENELGDIIRKETGAKVMLKNPDVEISAEIRQRHAHIYCEKEECIGGMPSGSSGKVLCILDGKGSQTAAFLAMRRGCTPIFLAQEPEQAEPLQRFLPEKARVYKGEAKEAGKFAKHMQALAIISGEDKITEYPESAVPIIRPLAGFDKDYLKKYAQAIYS